MLHVSQFLNKLFRVDSNSLEIKDLCRKLSKTLGQPLAPREQVQACLRGVIVLFESEASTIVEKSELLVALLGSKALVRMLEVLPVLEFESRKDIMKIFNHMLALGAPPVFDYMRCETQILQLLLKGCGHAEVALNSNIMLRCCTKHAQLVETLLEAGVATEVLKLTLHSNFDISSDAFGSLRELLLGHKVQSAAYLEKNIQKFFGVYSELIESQDYVTKRQSLRLLVEILSDEQFRPVMLRYVNDDRFLRIHMNLLREDSKMIKYDAFRLFILFVVNSEQSSRAHRILVKNQDKLVKFIESLDAQSLGLGTEDSKTLSNDKHAVIQHLLTL
jgi:calcium binding protein 39